MLIQTIEGKSNFIRENWKELFRIKVSGFAYHLKEFKLPKGFVKTHNAIDRDIDYYWFILLVPFVKVILWLNNRWWQLGKWCHRKGWLKIKEGEKRSCFWLKYFRINPK